MTPRWVRLAACLATLVVVSAPALGPVVQPSAGAAATSPPNSPVGRQLAWLLGAAGQAPLSGAEVAAHFDAAFLAQAGPAQINAGLAAVGNGPMTLLSLSTVEPTSLVAVVSRGPIELTVRMDVDSEGLISGLLLTPLDSITSWAQVNRQLSSLAPGVGFLAARLTPDGSCTAVHAIDPSTPRPLGSMFKLFVLGALANAIHARRISWDQELTLTAGIKVGGSGTLDAEPDGTQLTVEQAATEMISVSDNTAADLLIGLLGRSAVEAQVQRWSSHVALDVPFLTVSELFALKYDDFPKLADHYLSLNADRRAAYLRSTVDKVTAAEEVSSTTPRDVNSIEWFASPDDLCRAFSGLRSLSQQPGLGPIASVMSVNNGGIQLSQSTWPLVWFKGGSESGVLTLGYLARDAAGQTDVVVAMTENPQMALNEQLDALRLLGIISGAFGLLQRSSA